MVYSILYGLRLEYQRKLSEDRMQMQRANIVRSSASGCTRGLGSCVKLLASAPIQHNQVAAIHDNQARSIRGDNRILTKRSHSTNSRQEHIASVCGCPEQVTRVVELERSHLASDVVDLRSQLDWLRSRSCFALEVKLKL